MDTFIVITFPEVQEYMEIPGFEDNSQLITNNNLCELYGQSAYLVNKSWLSESSFVSETKLEDGGIRYTYRL